MTILVQIGWAQPLFTNQQQHKKITIWGTILGNDNIGNSQRALCSRRCCDDYCYWCRGFNLPETTIWILNFDIIKQEKNFN